MKKAKDERQRALANASLDVFFLKVQHLNLPGSNAIECDRAEGACAVARTLADADIQSAIATECDADVRDRCTSAIAEALARQDAAGACRALSDHFPDEAFPGSESDERQVSRILAQAGILVISACRDEAARGSAADSLVAFLGSLMAGRFAGAATEASDRQPIREFTATPPLARTIKGWQAVSAYRRAKFGRCKALLDQRAEPGGDDELGRLLRLLILYGGAERNGDRSEFLREAQMLTADGLELPDSVPAVILGDVLRAFDCIGGDALDRLLEGPYSGRLADAAPALLAEVSARRRFHQAYLSSDLGAMLQALHQLEQAGAPLPDTECAELPIAIIRDELDATVLDGFFDTVSLNRRSQFLLALAVLHCMEANSHARAAGILNAVFEEYLDVLKNGDYNAAHDGVAYLSALLDALCGDVRGKTLPALPPAPFLNAWDEAVQQALSSESTSREDVYLLIRMQAYLATAYGDFTDAERVFRNFEAIAAAPGVLQDLRALRLLSSLLGAAARRPRYPLLQQMTERFRRAFEEQFPTIDDLVAFCSGGALHDAIAVLQALGRYGEIMTLCKRVASLHSSVKEEFGLARALMGTRSRHTSFLGLERIEAMHRRGLLQQPSHRAILVRGRLRLARQSDLNDLIADAAEFERLAPHLSARDAVLALKKRWGNEAVEGFLKEQLWTAARRFSRELSTKHFSLMREYERFRKEEAFLEQTNAFLNAIPQPAQPKGVIAVLAAAGDLRSMPVLAFRELKQRGYAVISLHPGQLTSGRTAIRELNELDGAVAFNTRDSRWIGEPREFLNAWQIDLANGKAVCRGVNFFQGVHESLCCTYRRFTIDYRCAFIEQAALGLVYRMDNIINAIDRIKEIARGTGVPIRIFVSAPHLAVYYAARRYISKISEDGDVELFHSCGAYENYYKNFSAEFGSTIAVRNLTRHSYLSRATMAPIEEFNRWYTEEWPSLAADDGAIDKVVQTSRVQRDHESVEAGSLLHEIRSAKRQGRTVACLLGKVLFDQAVPIAEGSAHADMREWFDHTLDIARRDPSLLLLVKPHPHELRPEIALYPSEVLEDWMPADVPDNVVFLPHNLLNLHEMAEFTDVTLIWNGSASMELGILGVPCIVAGLYGVCDFPLGHTVPRDRAHYEWLLRHPSEIKASPEIADRSRALMTYLKSEHVSIPYRYTLRPLTNKKISRPGWFKEDIERYLSFGDPFVSLLADRIEGGSELYADPELDWTSAEALLAAADPHRNRAPSLAPTTKLSEGRVASA